MSGTLATVAAVLLGLLAIIVGTAFVSVWRAGPHAIGRSRRKGFTFSAYANGGLVPGNRGTTASELEGLEMKAVNGRLVWVRPTCTASSETV